MTNKEYFISLLGFAPGPNVVEGALIDAGITEGAIYTGNRETMLPYVIRTLKILLSTANTTNAVTGFSISYDRGHILKLIGLYEDELGIKAVPTIRGVNVW